jgi:hypothetical protein
LQSQAAETAVKALAAAHTNEAEKWRAYYVTRLARVQAECTAINPTPKPRARAVQGAEQSNQEQAK